MEKGTKQKCRLVTPDTARDWPGSQGRTANAFVVALEA